VRQEKGGDDLEGDVDVAAQRAVEVVDVLRAHEEQRRPRGRREAHEEHGLGEERSRRRLLAAELGGDEEQQAEHCREAQQRVRRRQHGPLPADLRPELLVLTRRGGASDVLPAAQERTHRQAAEREPHELRCQAQRRAAACDESRRLALGALAVLQRPNGGGDEEEGQGAPEELRGGAGVGESGGGGGTVGDDGHGAAAGGTELCGS